MEIIKKLVVILLFLLAANLNSQEALETKSKCPLVKAPMEMPARMAWPWAVLQSSVATLIPVRPAFADLLSSLVQSI